MQVDRLLSNDTNDVDVLLGYWMPYVVGARPENVVLLVWMRFARNGHDTIMVSLLSGHVWATQPIWRTEQASPLKGNRRRYEHKLVRVLAEEMRARVKVTVVADRGFGNGPGMQCMSDQLRFEYILPVRGNILATSPKGERRRAAESVGVKGRSLVLCGPTVADVYAFSVSTVVCVQATPMQYAWCVVTSRERFATRTLTPNYPKRWGIEASFRDIKDMPFGAGMSVVRIWKPQRPDHMVLHRPLSIALLIVLAVAAESSANDQWRNSNTVKARRNSLFSQRADGS